MDEEEEFQFQEKIMFPSPKCSYSTVMFQKKTTEKRRK